MLTIYFFTDLKPMPFEVHQTSSEIEKYPALNVVFGYPKLSFRSENTENQFAFYPISKSMDKQPNHAILPPPPYDSLFGNIDTKSWKRLPGYLNSDVNSSPNGYLPTSGKLSNSQIIGKHNKHNKHLLADQEKINNDLDANTHQQQQHLHHHHHHHHQKHHHSSNKDSLQPLTEEEQIIKRSSHSRHKKQPSEQKQNKRGNKKDKNNKKKN